MTDTVDGSFRTQIIRSVVTGTDITVFTPNGIGAGSNGFLTLELPAGRNQYIYRRSDLRRSELGE